MTASEVDNLGFEIMRGLAKEGPYQQIWFEDGQYTTNQRTEYKYVDTRVSNGITYWYKLVDVDVNGVRTEHPAKSATPQASNVEITTISSDLPQSYRLRPAYPNPFNPKTNFEFDVPVTTEDLVNVRLTIYNLLGQQVKTLFDGQVEPGTYQVSWDATTDFGEVVPAGIYIAVFRSNFFQQAVKLTLLK